VNEENKDSDLMLSSSLPVAESIKSASAASTALLLSSSDDYMTSNMLTYG